MHPTAAFRGARAAGPERVRPAYDHPRGCGQRGAAAGHVGHAAPRLLCGSDRSLHTHFELASGPERQRVRLAARGRRDQRAGGAWGVAAACGGGAMARNSQRVRATRHASRLFYLHHQTLIRGERPRRLYAHIIFTIRSLFFNRSLCEATRCLIRWFVLFSTVSLHTYYF